MMLNFQVFQSRWLKFSLKIVLLILPFSIGFAFHPIYEGDFALKGQKVLTNHSKSDFKKNGLTVVAIVDCPFCFSSISKLKMIKKRNPNIAIDFVVCTKDKNYITNYIKEAEGVFKIRLAENPDSLALIAGWRFPTFIKVENKKPVYLWSNDQFGVRAIDQLESNY